MTHFTEDEILPTAGRKPIKDGGMPADFNKRVIRRLYRKCSSAYVTMVRKGKRTNDYVLMAIIKVDHQMTHMP